MEEKRKIVTPFMRPYFLYKDPLRIEKVSDPKTRKVSYQKKSYKSKK
jgi:hypothetical protein